MHRGGILYANAILPDGTRAMIPQSWTDYSVAPQLDTQQLQARQATATLASVSDLLHARVVLAPVLARIQRANSERTVALEVESNATVAELRTRNIRSTRIAPQRLADAQCDTSKRDRRSSGSVANKGHCRAKQQRSRGQRKERQS